jgi:hypothetical protein
MALYTIIQINGSKTKSDRDNLKYSAGYSILVLRYDQDWRGQLSVLSSLLHSTAC